jgi:sensor histidine kinase YesM
MSAHSSLYWKCQWIGWTAFTVVAFLFNGIIYRDWMDFVPFSISMFVLGFVFSHSMKLLIDALRVMEKRFSLQLLYLSLIIVVFGVSGTYIWMRVMMALDIWKLVDQGTGRTSTFTQAYFFNLFPVLLTLAGWVLIYFLYHYVQGVRRQAREKAAHEKQLLEMEARALRAQMNPHFIFNCLNSIKALIQSDEKLKATEYLTMFSKLIRTLFQNSDKRQISLYDEVETCRLYLQLEQMRFERKLKWSITVDPELDLKSVMVPALIIQPFLENAVLHGIVPKENGGTISLTIAGQEEEVTCTVEDDGVGREVSLKNKGEGASFHISKGVAITQSRLNLEKKLNSTEAKVEIIDKYENNEACGTKVILTFNLN